MPKKIVIVEDESSLSLMYKFKLEADGYDVRVASDSWEGVDIVESFRPDLLLLDIMMPYETGDVTLAKIRQTKFGKNLKVLFMTNTDMQEAPKAIRSMNFKRYIIKANMTPKQVSTMVGEELNDKSRVLPKVS
jgi:DNA-binding response OmpR family regulator